MKIFVGPQPVSAVRMLSQWVHFLSFFRGMRRNLECLNLPCQSPLCRGLVQFLSTGIRLCPAICKKTSTASCKLLLSWECFHPLRTADGDAILCQNFQLMILFNGIHRKVEFIPCSCRSPSVGHSCSSASSPVDSCLNTVVLITLASGSTCQLKEFSLIFTDWKRI